MATKRKRNITEQDIVTYLKNGGTLPKYAFGDYKKDFKGFIKNNFGLEHSNNFGLPFKGIDFSKETLFNFYNGYKIKRKAYLEGILNEINNEDNLNNESLQEKMFVFLNKKNYVIRRDYKDNLSKLSLLNTACANSPYENLF